MGYRSEVRIVTSKEGFEIFREFVENYLKEKNIDYNLINDCDIKRDGKNQCYFGWNDVKWYEGSYEDVDAIMEGLNHLGENEYSYRYMRIGENREDYDEQSYDADRETEPYLEYPSLIRGFDDEYVYEAIKDKQTNEKEENKEDIDI